MPILSEFILTPDVFDRASYTNEELADSRLDLLREVLFNEGIVRDLRNGEWRAIFPSDRERSWHRWAKELVSKLEKQGRLQRYPNVLEKNPASDGDWISEALATHCKNPVKAIISTDKIIKQHEERIITSISKLANASWWEERRLDDGSVRLERNVNEYVRVLRLLFSCSNNLMFIDRNLDPVKYNYKDFHLLIEAAFNKKPMPTVEIHRTISEGGGRQKKIVSGSEWESRFEEGLLHVIPAGAKVEIFLWDDMHDRYLVSNILAVSLPYGFDTSNKKNDITTWTRLGRKIRDDLMREFDPASHCHKLQGRFVLNG